MLELKHKNSGENGFILVYVLIALLVLSIMMTPFFNSENVNKVLEENNLTSGIPADISTALYNYAMKNGHYPAPANPTRLPTDPEYGTPVALAPFGISCASLESDGVKCRPGDRDTKNAVEDGYVMDALGNPVKDANGNCAVGSADGNPDPVLIGMVPVSVLGLNPDQGLDQYGRKLTYAVSQYLTQSTNNLDELDDCAGGAGGFFPFKNESGVITLLDEYGARHKWQSKSPVTTASNIHYIVVNHGRNGSGAYVGNARSACPEPAAGITPTERENCDDDAQFVALYPIIQLTNTENTNLISDEPRYIDSPRYFDDGIAVRETLFIEPWSQLNPDGVYFTNANGKNVFVAIDGTNLKTVPQAQFYVNGNIKATTMSTKKICSGDRNYCYDIDNLTSEDPLSTSKCISSRGLKQLNQVNYGGAAYYAGSISAVCDPFTVAPAEAITNDCPAGARGMNSSGQLICM